jgi:hypothetical protein
MSSIDDGKFFVNIYKIVGGGDTMHKKLCRGEVQIDGGSSARDKMKELRDLADK